MKSPSHGSLKELLTVVSIVSVHVNVVVRVLVFIFVLIFVPGIDVLLEQVGDLLVRGREHIVPVILFLLVAVLVLQLSNETVRVDVFR